MHEQEDKWAKEHVDKTFEIIKKVKEKKPKHIKLLDKVVYWVILLLAVIGNFIISIPMILFLFVLQPLQLYPIIILMGVSFGLLIEILIRDIEHLERRHHMMFVLIIPFLALINFFIITLIVDRLKITTKFNPFIVGITYAISFILPYIYYQVMRKA